MKKTRQTKKHLYDDSELEEILDLDEDEDLNKNPGEEEYWEEEIEEEDFEDEEEWHRDLKGLGNRKLLLGMAVSGVLILAVVIIAFSFYLKNAKNEREAVLAQMELTQVAEPQVYEVEPTEDTVQTPEEIDSEDTNSSNADGQASDNAVSPDTQTEVSVGALDDAQDPQNSGASGNEENGAEVTVKDINENETSGTTMGIDVSKYQGTIDWAKVKASGVEFAMIRVGYRAKSTGEIFEDPTARYNMQEAQAAGIKIGAYFFSSAVTQEEARAEAAFTKDIIAKYRITYPVAYNCEDFLSPDSRQYGMDAAARTDLACAFLDEISAGGYTPMFYASKGELDGSAQWNTETLAAKYKIWVAQYPEQPYPATGASSYSGTHDMWQYTSQGIVDGISKKTDVNIAYFGYTQEAEAKDETPAEVVAANPEVGINFTEVNETVTAKQETNLRSEPSTLNDDSIVAKLVHGDTATRTGIGHNGWSRVIYNGQTLYAVSSYLTTDMADTGQQAPPQGPVYTPVNEQVTAKIETNLRTEPSTANNDTVVGLLRNGEVLTRTAIGDNGWSQLEYNGQTVYAVSSYLVVP